MIKEASGDSDLWRSLTALTVLHRALPLLGSDRASSVDSEEPTKVPLSEMKTRELQTHAPPVALVVTEYDTTRPWRYVRWRKANQRQALPLKERKAEQPKGNFVYKVLPGEELAEVASKYNTYTEVLMEANRILNPRNVATGQLLWVPRTHLICRGNTLWSLSRKFGVSIATIQKANGIENPDLIFAGDILVIPEELE